MRTPVDIGAAIRASREDHGWTLNDLAQRAGVSRRWLIQVEHGHPRAELSHVLKVFQALGLDVEVRQPQDGRTQEGTATRHPRVDLGAHLASYGQEP